MPPECASFCAQREELSVAELQEILAMGQSRISTHLAQLRQAGLVEDRRQGKNSLYSLKSREPMDILRAAADEIPEAAGDTRALQLVLEKRRDKVRGYFDELAGKFGRNYVPGRSWKGLAETLLQLMPPMVIADLGAGEGTFSQLLAQRARKVIAIDNSPKMVEFGVKLAQTTVSPTSITGWEIWKPRRFAPAPSTSPSSARACTMPCTLRRLSMPPTKSCGPPAESSSST